MAKTCPGNISQNLKAEYFKCNGCGYDVEIFTDELQRKCPGCGKSVYRERIPSCIDWCSAAKECIGAEKWMELVMEEKLKSNIKDIFAKSVPRYFAHTLSVVENMRKIFSEIKDPEDKILLLGAAYLHDIGYSKKYGNDYVGNIKDQDIKMKLHSEEGAKIAGKILEEIGVDKKTEERISYLVSVHHRKDIEDKLLGFLLKADTGCLCGN